MKIGGIEDSLANAVAESPELLEKRRESSVLLEMGYIFERDELRFKFCDKGNDLKNEIVALIPAVSLAERREALARGACRDEIKLPLTKSELPPQSERAHVADIVLNEVNFCMVQAKGPGCDGVILDGGKDVCALSLQTGGDSPSTGKQVDRSSRHVYVSTPSPHQRAPNTPYHILHQL
jgi:hypothetical protein